MNSEEIISIAVASLKQIAPDTDPEVLDHDVEYRQALDIDSFDALRFIVDISEKLNIEIPEEDYGKITTLESLARYIQSAAS